MNRVKLGELLRIKHGYAFKSENYVTSSPYALVTLANISSSNSFRFDQEKTTFYGASFPEEFILHTDDLIMPLTEQVIGLFGNSAFIPSMKEIRFVLNQRVGKVIPNEGKADKYYLHYLLSTEIVREQLEHRASGTKQRNISPDDVYNVTVVVPELNVQQKIGKALYCLEAKVNVNNAINDNLQQQLRLMYDYWFNQFDFPNEEGKPYRASGGKMQYSFRLKRDIPEGWTEESVISNSISVPIKPGVERFSTKSYLATADVNGTRLSSGSLIDYETREGRANMQPTVSSVWFAKMKNSIKHLFLNREMKQLIDSTILSTGFCGLQCTEKSFEYISAFIEHSYFEDVKNILAHGATQESVNNDDLLGLGMLVPTSEVLELFHAKAKPLYAQISRNICENQKLTEIRDWLLPMLMNGQATISD